MEWSEASTRLAWWGVVGMLSRALIFGGDVSCPLEATHLAGASAEGSVCLGPRRDPILSEAQL